MNHGSPVKCKYLVDFAAIFPDSRLHNRSVDEGRNRLCKRVALTRPEPEVGLDTNISSRILNPKRDLLGALTTSAATDRHCGAAR